MRIIDLGLTNFSEADDFQRDCRDRVARLEWGNTLIISEHRPVITIGRKGSWENILRSREFLLSKGIGVFAIDRGGDVTYHGPGQIVAYPVFRLENEARDIYNFLRYLEEVGAYFLSQYGLQAALKPGLRGLWIKDKKIASIGIGIKKWVTYHGMAINVNNDVGPFLFIRPCGIEGVEIASLKEILGREIDIEDAKNKLKLSFSEVPLLAETVSKD